MGVLLRVLSFFVLFSIRRRIVVSASWVLKLQYWVSPFIKNTSCNGVAVKVKRTPHHSLFGIQSILNSSILFLSFSPTPEVRSILFRVVPHCYGLHWCCFSVITSGLKLTFHALWLTNLPRFCMHPHFGELQNNSITEWPTWKKSCEANFQY